MGSAILLRESLNGGGGWWVFGWRARYVHGRPSNWKLGGEGSSGTMSVRASGLLSELRFRGTLKSGGNQR